MFESRGEYSHRLKAALLSLIIVTVYQCSTSVPQLDIQKDLPIWFTSQLPDSSFIFGVGQATDLDSTRAIQKAVARARTEILQAIKTEIVSTVKVTQSSHSDQDSSDSAEYLSINKAMSSGVFADSEVVMIEWGDEHRVYVLVRYPRMLRANDLEANSSVTD